MKKFAPNPNRENFAELWAHRSGESDAIGELSAAKTKADAKAARLLAARECPNDLIEWGRVHGIPTFAEYTWQAGFLAGMRAAMLSDDD